MSSQAYSSHPENNQGTEFELMKKEMTKMYEARRKMKRVYGDSGGGDVGDVGGVGDVGDVDDVDFTDMTKEDISIVCEELWIDFKIWMNGRNNACDCAEKVGLYFSRNWVVLLCGALFMIAFRWYVGSGKDACAYGFG